MYYEIQSIEELDNGLTRTVVWFWADHAAYLRDPRKPLFREDFISNVQPTGWRIVTNDDGHWKASDGSWVDPATLEPEKRYEFVREEYEVDVAGVLVGNIERFLETEHADGTTNADRIIRGELRGDRTSKQLERRQVASERRAAFLDDRRVRDIVRAPRAARVQAREVTE